MTVILSANLTHHQLMSLGTGALKVSGEGPEVIQALQEVSMATWQAGTTHLLRGLETGGSRWSGNMEPLNLPKRLQAPLSPNNR